MKRNNAKIILLIIFYFFLLLFFLFLQIEIILEKENIWTYLIIYTLPFISSETLSHISRKSEKNLPKILKKFMRIKSITKIVLFFFCKVFNVKNKNFVKIL